MGLYLKIAGTIVGIVALALALGVLLSYEKFERSYSDLVESRFIFKLRDLRTDIERGLDLGIPLSELDTVARTMTTTAGDDAAILSISVHDDRGRAQLATGMEPASPPELALAAIANADGLGEWSNRAAAGNVITTVLTNDFGTVSGVLVLQYDRSIQSGVTERQLARLVEVGVWLLVGAATIALIAVVATFRGTQRAVARMSAHLQAREDGDGTGDGATAPPFDPGRSTLERRYAHAIEVLDEARRAVDQARAAGANGSKEPGT